ncbi:MAG TPA: hypothetical protein VG014_01470 [Acidimicrobiales bacterium]|jgi:hypothetical protein|nr:hypothetical protein [Acidimicrobiales bacterium]
MTTLQTEFSESELLAEHPIAEPLIVNQVRCHGGFDEDGHYVSPRTKNRWPAIHAWEEQRMAQFATPILDVPLETWPESFPNVDQSKLLLRRGVVEPTITSLTRIGTVEGFGGMLRMLPTPDFAGCFDEEITGTAIAHIDGGLFEAHARDESGFGDQAGHDRMWFAARDIAFENPATEDHTARMLARMGIDARPKSAEEVNRMQRAAIAGRALPADIDFTLEVVVGRMISLLLIEISAFHGFKWAEAVLSDTELVAGDGAAATLVSYIRADETPHVAWLRTALSEMRDRTWVGESGRTYDGAAMIEKLWDRALENSLLLRRQENLQFFMQEIEEAVDGRSDGADLIEEMLGLGTVTRLEDGTMVDTASRALLG